jgi:hypothetical protein
VIPIWLLRPLRHRVSGYRRGQAARVIQHHHVWGVFRTQSGQGVRVQLLPLIHPVLVQTLVHVDIPLKLSEDVSELLPGHGERFSHLIPTIRLLNLYHAQL